MYDSLVRNASLLSVVLMFVFSSVQKIRSLGGGGGYKRFVQLFGFPVALAKATVLFGALWEVAGLLLVLAGKLKRQVRLFKAGLLLLALFTVTATALFKIKEKINWIPVLANLSVAGSLVLLALNTQQNEL